MPRSHLSPSRAHLPRRNTARISHCDRQDILRAACHAVWIELLEPRTLLAINAFINARILTVTSTAADVIQIFPTGGNGGTLTVDGNNGAQTFGPFDPDDYDGILVDAAGMNDRVTLMTNAQTAATSTMLGGAGNDTLIGDGGTTFFVGGTGNDYMEGMQGSDVYVFEPVAAMETDLIAEMEFAGEGVNVLTFAGLPGFAAAVGSAGADNVTINVSTQIPGFPDFIAQHNNRDIFAAAGFTPKGMHVLVGGWDDDDITGSSLANTLVGDLGDDDLNGLEENDVYLFEDADPLFPEDDTITEPAVNSGIDLVSFGGLTVIDTFNQNASVISFDAVTLADLGVDLTQVAPNLLSQDSNLSRQITSTTPGELENVLGGLGNDDITGNDLDNRLSGNFGEDEIEGNGGNDKLFGEFDVTPGVNRPGRLLGGTQDDTLSGSGGNDELWGGFGNDEMKGGAGDNVWVFENASGDEMDVVDADQAGNNKLDFSRVNQAGITIDLTKDTPNNIASHGGASSSRTVKTKAAGQAVNNINRAVGGTRGDTIIGNDLPNTLDGNNGGDNIRGGDEDDNLIGGDGDDTLNGDDGDDFLADQFGNNTFVFTSVNQGFEIDTIDQPVTPNSINTIDFSALPANDPVDIDLANDGAIAAHTGRTVTHFAAGQALALQIAIGGVGNDIIRGNSVSNTLVGNAGNDVIDGRASDDRINGGAGGDDMTGGDGNDTYIFADPVGIELDSLTELGTGNSGVADHLDFSGSTVAVIINLGSFLLARQGNRFLTTSLLQTGRIENATGGSGNDTITGNATSNRLAGGPGDDTYRFNKSNNPNDTDTLIELANQGNDTLDFSLLLANDPVTVNLTNGIAPVLAQHANRSVVVAMAGQAANFENAIGGAGNDTITGNDADNRLEGRAGNDSLDGRGGNDTAIGGIGNDSYRFTSAPGAFEGDTVSELPNEGIDTLDFAQLPANEPVDADLSLDNFLAIHGSRVVSTNAGESANFENLIGSPGDDMLKGNAAVNTLEGMAGNDRLEGRAGSDIYRYAGMANKGTDQIIEVGGCVDKDLIQFVNTAAVTLDLGKAILQNNVIAGGRLNLTLSTTTSIEDANPRAGVTLNGCLLSMTPWMGAGPTSIINGQVEMIPGNNPVAGAIKAIAFRRVPDGPGFKNLAYIATINGGVWRTDNALAANPVWTAKSDDFPLSIGAVDIDPTDQTGNTVVAGIGRWSSGAGTGGRLTGVIRSTDGGSTWTLLPGLTTANRNISAIAARGNIILAAASNTGTAGAAAGGLFISTDTGMTFNAAPAPFPAGNVSDLVGDPTNDLRFYATVLGQGIFRTSDGGVTWLNVTRAILGIAATDNNMIVGVHHRLNADTITGAFSSDGGPNGLPMGEIVLTTNSPHGLINGQRITISGVNGTMGLGAAANGMQTVRVYDNTHIQLMGVAFPAGAVYNNGGSVETYNVHLGIVNNGSVAGVFTSSDVSIIPDNGAVNPTWTALGVPPVHQPAPAQGRIHFSLSADPLNSNIVYVGGDVQTAAPFSGRLVRWDPATNTWLTIVRATAGGTSPHADSRDIVAIEDPTAPGQTLLIEADDGGLYRRTNATNAGGMGSWNSANGNLNIVEFYAVDNDAVNHRLIGGTQDLGNIDQINQVGAANQGLWQEDSTTDGNAGDGADVVVDDSGASSLRYDALNRFRGVRRRTVNAAGTVTATTGYLRPIDGAGNVITPAVGAPLDTFPFTARFVANSIAPAQLVVGSNTSVWESLNMGGNWTQRNFPALAQVSAVAYGGRRNSVNNANIIYAGTFTAPGQVLLRTGAGAAAFTNNPFPGGAVTDIVVDPDDWMTAYVLTSNQVFRTTDGTATWTNITGNLANKVPGGTPVTAGTLDLRSIEIVARGCARQLVVGGLGGIFTAAVGLPGVGAPGLLTQWQNFGSMFPREVLVRDVRYDRTDDLLVIGTWGRGASTISSFSTLLTPAICNVQFNSNGWMPAFRTFTPPAMAPDVNLPVGDAAGLFAPVGTGNLQLSAYPWENITKIAVRFTKDVSINQNSLMINGQSAGDLISAFTAPAAGNMFTATWTLINALQNGRFTLTVDADGANAVRGTDGAVLDGNWNNPTALNNNPSSRFNSGDGMPGGNFVFNFNYLLGDANGNGAVTVADVNYIRARVGRSAAAPGPVGGANNYDIRADINGDGMIDNMDVALARAEVGKSLPDVPAPFSPEDQFADLTAQAAPRTASRAPESIFADRQSIASLVFGDAQDSILVAQLPEV